jgi:O-antigen/teichoic acid export membrane protein
LVLLAPILIEIIPRYEKWQPGLFTLALFGVSACIGAVTTPLTNLLSAIGKIKTTFKLMVMWTVLTWLIIPYLAVQRGLDGVAIGVFLVSLSSIVAIVAAYRQVPFDWIYAIGKPLVASTVMGAVIFLLGRNLPHNTLTVLLLIAVGASVYAATIISLVGATVLQDGRKVLNAIFKR